MELSRKKGLMVCKSCTNHVDLVLFYLCFHHNLQGIFSLTSLDNFVNIIIIHSSIIWKHSIVLYHTFYFCNITLASASSSEISRCIIESSILRILHYYIVSYHFIQIIITWSAALNNRPNPLDGFQLDYIGVRDFCAFMTRNWTKRV